MSSEDADERADQLRCTEIAVDRTPEAAFVSNLGTASYVLAGVEDRDLNFYLWGSMGVTTPVGLGLAMAADRLVTVLDGDGSTLMSMGALATVSRYDPSNLTVVIWDNQRFNTTGGQPTLSEVTDFGAVAEGVGLRSYTAMSNEEFREAYAAAAVEYDGAAVVVCSVSSVSTESRPPFDFAHIKHRFRNAMRE